MTTTTTKKLKSVDLFSGIGGNALALRSILQTVAFCEIDPFARSVLERKMSKSQLDRAPIFPDVTKLKASDIPELPDVITASFPCQDISQAGTGEGLKGERSGLVKHVLRLVDEFEKEKKHIVSFVFMENSSMIKHRGLKDLVDKLKARRFNCVWCVVSGAGVGARHIRRRWFMLASRDGLAEPAPKATLYKHNFNELDTIPRLIRTTDPVLRKDSRSRFSALGNAVVPRAVSTAWNVLQSSSVLGDLGADKRLVPKWPVSRYDTGEERQYWPTPVHTDRHWYPTQKKVGRHFNMFATRVFHELGTKRSFKYTDIVEARHKLMINPNWVENLMGYPKNWTQP